MSFFECCPSETRKKSVIHSGLWTFLQSVSPTWESLLLEILWGLRLHKARVPIEVCSGNLPSFDLEPFLGCKLLRLKPTDKHSCRSFPEQLPNDVLWRCGCSCQFSEMGNERSGTSRPKSRDIPAIPCLKQQKKVPCIKFLSETFQDWGLGCPDVWSLMSQEYPAQKLYL